MGRKPTQKGGLSPENSKQQENIQNMEMYVALHN